MKLFNKTIDRQLFKQYALGSDLSKQEAVVKIFNPFGNGTWFILNSDPNDPDYLWAIVDLGYGAEVGSVSRADLETYRGRFGMGFERDLSFDPVNAEELYEGLRAGKFYADGGGVDKNADLYGKDVAEMLFLKKKGYAQVFNMSYSFAGLPADVKMTQAINLGLSTARNLGLAYFVGIDDNPNEETQISREMLEAISDNSKSANIVLYTNAGVDLHSKEKGTYKNIKVVRVPFNKIRPENNYADGGRVSFIDYKDAQIMFEPHFDKYYSNEVEFDSLQEAKDFLDSGEIDLRVRNAYAKGAFADGGQIEVVYERRADFKKKPVKLILLQRGKEQKGYTFSGKDQVAVLDDYNRNKQEDLEKLWNLKGYETKYAEGGSVSGDEVSLAKGYGYYDLSKYAYGNDFKRFVEPVNGKFIKGTVKVGGQIRVLLDDGREIITDKQSIDLPTYDKKDALYQQNKHLFSFGYADGGEVNIGYNVFNYTDNIYATDEVFKTKALANKFIKEFRSRFANQGYYRDNRMNKINIQDIDLLEIPSDFNPFKKYADGGDIENFSDNQRMIMNQNVEVEHHHEELEDILEDEVPVPAWVVAKMETATQNLSDITHYLDGQKEIMEDQLEENDDDDDDDDDQDEDEIKNKEVVEPINVSAGTKAEMTKNFTDNAWGNLRGFLKGMEGIDLRDDYTFDYKDEQFEVEPIINSDENGVSNAVFTIFDGDGEEQGEVTYSRQGGKQKFTANSELFGWNNAKFEDGGYFDGTIPKVSTYMSNYDKGGEIAKAEVFGLKRNIMGTTDIEMKISGMRKAQDFIVYPIGADDAGSVITIQSDTRIGQINLVKGVGVMSQSHSNGAYFVHLQMDKLTPFTISESDLANIKSHIFKTAGDNVGSRGIVSDNSGASRIFAEGGGIGFIPMDLEETLRITAHWGGTDIKGVIGFLNAMIDSDMTDEDLKPKPTKSGNARQNAIDKKTREIWSKIEPNYKGGLKGNMYYSTIHRLVDRANTSDQILKRFKPFRNLQKDSFADGGSFEDYDGIAYAKTNAKRGMDWDKELREYAGSDYSKLTEREKEAIISDLMRDWDRSNSFADGGNFDKPFNVLYKTKSGTTMVAKRIMAKDEKEAERKLEKQMRASSSFDKVVMSHPSFEDGGFMSDVYAKGGMTLNDGNKDEGYNLKDINGKKIEVGDTVKTTQPSGGLLSPADSEVGVVEKTKDAFGQDALQIKYRRQGTNYDRFILLNGKINEIVSKSSSFAKGRSLEDKLTKLKDKKSDLESKLFEAQLKSNSVMNNIGFGAGMRRSKVSFSTSREDSLKERIKSVEQEIEQAKEDMLPKKPKYILKADIKTVTVKRNGKEVTYKGADVLNGANVLSDGGDISSKANYIPKRDVVEVELKDGSTVKPVNGYWVKKGAEPIGTESTPSSLAKSETKINTTEIRKDPRGNWRAETFIENFDGYDWKITTIKTYSGQLLTSAQGGKTMDSGSKGISMFKYAMYEDPHHTLEVSQPKRLTEKVVSEQHDKGLAKFKKFMETGMFKGGGKISNFDKLSAKVAKQYEGKAVKNPYQEEYGKYYSKEEAQEVGDKVAGKVKAMQGDSKAFGGLFSSAKNLMKPSVKYPNLRTKQVQLKSGRYVQVFNQNGNKLDVIFLGDIGRNVKPHTIDIEEVDLTTMRMGGEVEERKPTAGSELMKKANILAKEIRKDGESWLDARKRAFAQLKK